MRRADQPYGVAQLVGVLEIERLNAADALGIDVGRGDLFTERERGQ